MQGILILLKKDLLLELRQQHTFYGILLYVASTVFVLYLAMGQPESTVYNGLFWMIQLFVCVNAVAKSFTGKQGPDALFLFNSKPCKLYHFKTYLQHTGYVCNDYCKPCTL